MISNSRNKVHRTWERNFIPPLYLLKSEQLRYLQPFRDARVWEHAPTSQIRIQNPPPNCHYGQQQRQSERVSKRERGEKNWVRRDTWSFIPFYRCARRMDSVGNTEWYIPQFTEHFHDEFIFTQPLIFVKMSNIFVSKHPVAVYSNTGRSALLAALQSDQPNAENPQPQFTQLLLLHPV